MIICDILKKFGGFRTEGNPAPLPSGSMISVERRPGSKVVLSIHKMARWLFKADRRGDHPFLTKGRQVKVVLFDAR